MYVFLCLIFLYIHSLLYISGLGEIRTALAFMLSFLTLPRLTEEEKTMNLFPTKTSLVVCPPSSIWKWEREAKLVHKLARFYTYHGKNRNVRVSELVKYDLVITTPDTIRAEFYPRNKEGVHKTLQKILFSRIFVDKAHCLKGWKQNRFRAVSRIHARHRWAITASPICNKPEDFFALCKFFRLEPFDKPKLWDDWIGLNKLCENGLERMQMLGKSLIFRRTKNELSDQLGIPEKISEDGKTCWFGGEDFDVYNEICSIGSSLKGQNLSDEEYKLKRSSLSLRKQQCVVSPYIMIKNLNKNKDSLNLRGRLNLNQPVFKQDNFSGKVPFVFMELDDFFYIPIDDRRRRDRKDKILIASGFPTALDQIAKCLERSRFPFYKLYGPLPIKQKLEIIEDFNTNPDGPQIMLVKTNVGNAGYDLTGANHILHVEPNWNPQTELQLHDLVHKIGQTKTVYVKR